MRGLRLLLVLLACLLASPALKAQTPAPNRAEIESLIGTLENEAERAKLVAQLKLMLNAQQPAHSTENPVEGLSQLAIDTLAVRINRFSVELWDALDFARAGQRINNWVQRITFDPMLRGQLLETLMRLAAVFGAALAVEWISRLALGRSRRYLETHVPRNAWTKAGHLFLLAGVELVPLALFAVTANLTLPMTASLSNSTAGLVAELMAATLLNGFVLARAAALAARLVLAPHAPKLRVPPIEDETAQYLHIWTRRFTDIWIYGMTLIDALVPLGLPQVGHAVLMRLLGLTIATLAVIFILQNRQVVAGWLRGNGERRASAGIQHGVHLMRQGLAGCWHALAIFYVVVIYMVWTLAVPGGFTFIVQRTFGTIAVILALWALSGGLRVLVGRTFTIADELKTRYPLLESRANLYLPVLRRVLVTVVGICGVMLLLQLWGVDSLVWLSSDHGRRLVGMMVTIGIAVALGIVFWEVASAVIERTIRRIDRADTRNARLRTFLPLLRTVIFVTIVVVVGLTVMAELGINIAPLLAGAGVVGLAIGFGSQALVKDVITGLFILFEDTINVGDVVDLDGKGGVVEAITIRTIRLRDMTGSQITIPFSAVTTIKNMTRDFSYYVFDVSVAYDQEIAQVEDVLKKVDEEMRSEPQWAARILAPIEILGVDKFGDYAITLKARTKTRPIQQWAVGREFNRRIKIAFDAAGISIPFPTSVQMFKSVGGGGNLREPAGGPS
ncbi:MAG: mechanosensitive ion channel [Alphaproteobacteria bacterium]|nr:mechanosensitive ion channel [Alphaproteobacteria bacterium]